ncbi:metallothionein, partial [Pseudomonas qingdaonensis]
CEACASGHRKGEPCRMQDCHCGEKPGESAVDNALDETFPASDPISP